MNIERWDPQTASDDELREVHAFGEPLALELDPETPPEPFELWRREVLQTSSFAEEKRWLARDTGGVIVGGAFLSLDRSGNNAHRANFDIEVAASQRRRGLGRALLAPVLDAAANDGRTTLTAGAPQGSVGEKFLAAVGTTHAFLDRRSRLRVAAVDEARLDGWIADAKSKAADYSLVFFDGPVPDEYLDAVMKVHEAMNDAPREGLDLEDEHDTREHFRDREARLFARGSRRIQLVARHDPTGELAGFTTISWHPLLPQMAWQWGTAVTREHRGHAIGRWIKAVNYRNLRELNPKAEFVDTWNAGSNQWMLAINDEMGFTPYIWYHAYQGSTESIRKAIA
ncbi:MAG TPA: GNAT family N-acetyltransferase [Acidimicrobiales bacterium]|nr:GNAT family N-acetyltransferase [Acidimicrobiales bacterium]